MSKFLITGGAGFIGAHLCEALIRQNHNVIILDNFNDFYAPQIKYDNLTEIKRCFEENCNDEQIFKSINGDIRDSAKLDEIMKTDRPDCVIHLAAYAGVRPSIENPELYYDVNINGTLCVLEAMKRNKVNKLIFASSSSVYGNNKKVPFSENDSVDNPISPYAATKKAGELTCYTYSHLYGINTACLRFFTVYGPRQRPDLAIYKFTKSIIEGNRIPFFGDGSTKRDYTYIDDIIHGILQATKWINKPSNSYDIFNLGESNTISLKEMVSTIEDALKIKAMINYLPLQEGDVVITNADISKAKESLKYQPKTEFKEGIKKFIDWYYNCRAKQEG